MKIRITGTEQETEMFVDEIEHYFDIISVSEFYPNNRKVKTSKEGRVYVELKTTTYDPKTGKTTTY